MHVPALDHQPNHSLCPECDERGKAMCVVVGRGLRTVHYHCLVCREQWMQTQTIPHDYIPFVRLFTND